MLSRFSKFTTDITVAYKNIQKIKRLEMDSIGMKGTHVNCISILRSERSGLTASELSKIAREDKAGISRALSQLEEEGYIRYIEGEGAGEKRKYRAKAVLTEKGHDYGRQVEEMIYRAVSFAGGELDDEKREIFYEVLGVISGNLTTYVEKLEEKNYE